MHNDDPQADLKFNNGTLMTQIKRISADSHLIIRFYLRFAVAIRLISVPFHNISSIL